MAGNENLKEKVKGIFRQVRDDELKPEEALSQLRVLNVEIESLQDWLNDVLGEGGSVSFETEQILFDIVKDLMIEEGRKTHR